MVRWVEEGDKGFLAKTFSGWRYVDLRSRAVLCGRYGGTTLFMPHLNMSVCLFV